MDQLREQLLDAFRQQMEIRRSLMELENSNMEIQMDTSKHLLTIAELVFRISICLVLSDSKHAVIYIPHADIQDKKITSGLHQHLRVSIITGQKYTTIS